MSEDVLDSTTCATDAISDDIARPDRRPRGRWAGQLKQRVPSGEDGMTTAEYAVGTVVACGFAGVLWAVVHSSTVAHLLQGVVERALQISL